MKSDTEKRVASRMTRKQAMSKKEGFSKYFVVALVACSIQLNEVEVMLAMHAVIRARSFNPR